MGFTLVSLRWTLEAVCDRVPDSLPGNENQDEAGDWLLKSQQLHPPSPSPGSGKMLMNSVTNHEEIPTTLLGILGETCSLAQTTWEFMNHQG